MKLRRNFFQSSPIFFFLRFKQYSPSRDWNSKTPAAARIGATQTYKPKPGDVVNISCFLIANPPPQEAKIEPSFPPQYHLSLKPLGSLEETDDASLVFQQGNISSVSEDKEGTAGCYWWYCVANWNDYNSFIF